MGDFKINKVVQDEPKYCALIQEKIDIAKKNGATYELDDEDFRIQRLYDQEDLTTKDDIKNIDRVLSMDDGKEYLVVSKNVVFYTTQKQGGQDVLVYKDSYSTNEGIVQLPLKTVNAEGVTNTNQTRLVYTIPFSAAKVDEYIRKANGKVVALRFYEGATTSNRLPPSIPNVGNRDYFVEATWTELLYGKEKKVLNSMVSRLDEVRKGLKGTEKQEEPQQEKIVEKKEEVVQKTSSTVQDSNKPVTDNKINTSNESETKQTSSTTSVKALNSKQPSKQ